LCTLQTAGCVASSIAKKGYDPGDYWLVAGVHRKEVERHMGPPVEVSPLPDGRIVATYEYGRSRPSYQLEVTHALLEGVTLGLWNVIGVPMELGRATAGERTRKTVTYGDDERIVSVGP